MDNITPSENNFFELTLSQQAASWLMRIGKISRWVFIASIGLSLLVFIDIGIMNALYMRIKLDNNWLSIFQTRIYPGFQVISIIIAIFQNYYYLKFGRTCKKAIETQQSDLFNESFKWLLKNALVTFTLIVLQWVMIAIALYAHLVLLLRMH